MAYDCRDVPEWRRHLLTDPQTSGGLLIACAADQAQAIAGSIKSAGYPSARIIGRAEGGDPVSGCSSRVNHGQHPLYDQ